ncbi:glycosyl hydrolase [Georgenia sp. SYP-B2076]|uniref:glycosyl hydrolase n=1 Tax=Georgenia sp. SYP-B2076 TaxID=2495881 RepID=UPI000F8C6F67|nr:glycosyl hydrolase [Georgenia sp. SYP-B2076]
MSDLTQGRNTWSGPANVFGAAVAAASRTSLRTGLIAVGLVAAMVATTLVIWGTPSLRASVGEPVTRAVSAMAAPPAAAATQDEQLRTQRAETRAALTALAQALTAADRETAAGLARQVLEISREDPMLGEMLADINLTVDQLWRIAGSGSARSFDELLAETGYVPAGSRPTSGDGGGSGSAAGGSGGAGSGSTGSGGGSGSTSGDRSGASGSGGSRDGGSGGSGGSGSSGGSGGSGDRAGAVGMGVAGDGTSGQAGPDSTEHDPAPAGWVPSTPKAPTKCWEFTWQQDAQVAYAADPTDPHGLDGNPGPRDDDGIACRDLLDDPRRPASEPVWPFVPTAPPADELLRPANQFFGIFTEESPYHFGEVDDVAGTLGHMPSSVTYFSGWDQDFRTDAATSAWTRGMLPIIAWEARPNETDMSPDSKNSVNPDYQLADIIDGTYDDYLRAYAADVAEFALPVGIRLNHEMNGIWYPWAEQVNGNKPGEYVAAWQHVHDIFTEAGAENVLWIWSPNVIEFPQAQPLDELYPGDEYVDIAGLVGYYRKPIEGKEASFQHTYGKSLAALRDLAPGKPIWLTEVGATEEGGNKVDWVTSFFEALAQNPDIIGFTWFQREVTAIPIGESKAVTNDWRLTSSPEVTLVARHGLRNGGFGEGRPVQPKPALPPLPTEEPTAEPTDEPTPGPTAEPTEEPTPAPQPTPTDQPTDEPMAQPTPAPQPIPTDQPTEGPTTPAARRTVADDGDPTPPRSPQLATTGGAR